MYFILLYNTFHDDKMQIIVETLNININININIDN